MINELVLGEFKAFRDEQIPLRPLTILVGENNSGKSSVIAALRLLAQTVQSPDALVPLIFDGPFGDFGAFRDVVHGNLRARPIQLGVTVPLTMPAAAFSRVDSDNTDSSASFLSEFKYRTQRRETVLKSTRIAINGRELLAIGKSGDGDRDLITAIEGRTVKPAIRASLRQAFRTVNFLPSLRPLELLRRERTSEDVARATAQLKKVERRARSATSSITAALRSVEVIGAMRQPPNRTYLHSGVVSPRIGVAGENWGGLIALAVSGRSKQPLLDEVTGWLQNAGIASEIRVAWLSDRHFEIKVRHPLTGERENISDVGRGTSQVLPVILGGYRLEKGDTYLVEEPEIHLHPRAQAALGDFFAELVGRGVQSVIETHSEHLITRLQQHVASGKIDQKDIIFYYVGAGEGGKTLTHLTLSKEATFEGSIPGGFFPQRLEEATMLARARAKAKK